MPSTKTQPRSSQPLSERGASGVEYGLLIALIAAVLIGGVILLGQDVLGLFGIANDPNWPPQ
ncbi:MAG: Flp family type IVb pilin [Nocardioidaceae bacterium]|nr:Flp family type IVb pilin [Nocardioidaceae bacterium]